MRKTKLIGAALMSSAIFLQVGYAATTTMSHEIVNTGNFDVYFQNPVVTESSDYVEVGVKENSNALDITVSNIYPGATFNLLTKMSNTGKVDAKITDINLNVKPSAIHTDLAYNTELMKMLVGYDEDNNAYHGEVAYEAYLTKAYKNYIIEQGKEIPIEFSIGMNSEITNLQSQAVEFSIEIRLEQVENKVNPPTDPDPTPDPDPKPDPDIEVPEEIVPGGEVKVPESEIEVPEESLPGGATEQPEVELTEVEISEEKVPGGGLLPQTGGITPTLVYSIGFAMLAGGLMLYRKEEKEE